MVKSIKRLTPEEIAEQELYMDTELTDSKAFIQKIYNSKDFKNTEKRSAQKLRDLEKFQRDVEKGKIMKKNNIELGDDPNSIYEPATMDDLNAITKLDREFYTDIAVLEGILMKKRCPLDGSEYRTESTDVIE